MDNLLNSPAAQWLLKFCLSRLGVLVSTAAAQLAAHLVLWGGLASFVSHDQLVQIQGGLEKGAVIFGNALLAALYAWVVHRQSQGVRILKQQLDASPNATPVMDMKSGAVGDATLLAAQSVTGVSVETAANSAGVNLPHA